MKLFLFVLLIISKINSEPCQDYACDSIVVRSILDSIGLYSVNIEEVSDSNGGRIEILTLSSKTIDVIKNIVLPSEIGNLTNLKILDMSGIGLDSLPDEIGNLINLESLILSKNKLRKLPLSIGSLLNLKKLLLDYNVLSDLPDSIINLNNLTDLDLSFNNLCSLDYELEKWACANDYDWKISHNFGCVNTNWSYNDCNFNNNKPYSFINVWEWNGNTVEMEITHKCGLDFYVDSICAGKGYFLHHYWYAIENNQPIPCGPRYDILIISTLNKNSQLYFEIGYGYKNCDSLKNTSMSKSNIIEDTFYIEWNYNYPLSKELYNQINNYHMRKSSYNIPTGSIKLTIHDTITNETDFLTLSKNDYYYSPNIDKKKGKLVESEILIYPNPFNPQTTISFPNPEGNAELAIYSINGRKVYQRTVIRGQKTVWSAADQGSGIYIILVRMGDKVLKKRVSLIK